MDSFLVVTSVNFFHFLPFFKSLNPSPVFDLQLDKSPPVLVSFHPSIESGLLIFMSCVCHLLYSPFATATATDSGFAAKMIRSVSSN